MSSDEDEFSREALEIQVAPKRKQPAFKEDGLLKELPASFHFRTIHFELEISGWQCVSASGSQSENGNYSINQPITR